MRKALLAGVAVAALFGGSALAADLRAPAYKAPAPMPAPVCSWTRLVYRHAYGRGGRIDHDQRPGAASAASMPGVPLSYDLNPVSIFGGGQVGYNWQFGAILLGAEMDLGYLGTRESHRPAPDDLVETKYGWYGTFTGRAGLVYDRLLAYVEGGAAAAKIRNTASDLDGNGVIADRLRQVHKTRWGWTIGRLRIRHRAELRP